MPDDNYLDDKTIYKWEDDGGKFRLVKHSLGLGIYQWTDVEKRWYLIDDICDYSPFYHLLFHLLDLKEEDYERD